MYVEGDSFVSFLHLRMLDNLSTGTVRSHIGSTEQLF